MSVNMGNGFNLGVLTVSDTGASGERAVDGSGDAICEIMAAEGYSLVLRDIVADERSQIAERLRGWCDGGNVDLVLTTGGTGLGPRDVTPEATRAILDIEAPGNRRCDAYADPAIHALCNAESRHSGRAVRLPNCQFAWQREGSAGDAGRCDARPCPWAGDG